METFVEPRIGEGCVILDKHTISSEYIGESQYGYPQFKTKYTELGELINALKYKNCKYATEDIIKLIHPHLDEYLNKVDLIIPAPPSDKNRKYQPVFELVIAIAKYLEKDYELNLLYKTSDQKAKDGKNVANTIKKNYNLDKKTNILLIDDLYNTGNTFRECCRVLKQDQNINNIYCLAMTKTKNITR